MRLRAPHLGKLGRVHVCVVCMRTRERPGTTLCVCGRRATLDVWGNRGRAQWTGKR